VILTKPTKDVSMSATAITPPGAVVLYGPDGVPLTPSSFLSPIDFGPGQPLPARISQPDFPPREFQYVPGFNLIPTPRTEMPGKRFAELRAYAALCPPARIAISYRKNQITGLKWSIAPRDDRSPSARKARQADIEPLEKFFRTPNRLDGVGWHQWVKQALEEVLVTDALVLFAYPARDGSVHSYVQLDGGTIKPLIDPYGHVAGYQQILYGYPASYYPAYAQDSAAEEPLAGKLRYLIHNPRVDSVYGTSPLEEIAPIIDTAIWRQLEHLAWYKEGNIPTATLEVPEGWTVTQIQQAQSYFDNLFSGAPDQRHKVRLIPHGGNLRPTKAFEFSKDENDALISSVCAHFGVPKHLFISETNRSTAQQLSDDIADVGFRPLRQFIKDALDHALTQDFDAGDLEWVWQVEETGREQETATALKMYVDAGIKTVDEVRKEIGLDPMPEEEKKKAEAKKAPPPGFGGGPFGGAFGRPPKPGAENEDEEEGEGEDEVDEEAAKAEIAQWRRFALRRLPRARHAAPFETKAVPKAVRRNLFKSLLTVETEKDLHAAFDKAAGEVILHKPADSLAVEASIRVAVKKLFAHRKSEALDHAKGLLG